jgi:ketosteroid isomerase-like protein
MSGENVETLKRGIDAFNRGDKAAWIALAHPDAETVPTPDWPEQGPYLGPEAAWEFYAQAEEVFATPPPEPEEWEIIDAGEKLFAANPRAIGVRGEDTIDFNLYGVFTFRRGKITRTQWFLEREQALEAAGLRER